ncbi:MAG: hypothetical protein KFB95_02500 [Simkaniaceae bacterium]|nr:MAG: hypothetical protein KFB95_02500 [Simkaniaceae bacterium]
MVNIKIQFAKELKEKIRNVEPFSKIGQWSHAFFLDFRGSDDYKFIKLLLDLHTMEEGEGFELSYEELEKIADDLIEEELKKPDPNIEKSATILDETWLMCPDCIDAWESASKSAMVICPKCNQIFHNPRFQKDRSPNKNRPKC